MNKLQPMGPDLPCSRLIKLRRVVDEVLHSLPMTPPMQAYGGGVKIWGCYDFLFVPMMVQDDIIVFDSNYGREVQGA